MSKFNKEKFKDNIVYFIISFVVIIFLLIFSIIYDGKTVREDEILSTGIEKYSKLVINEIASNNKGTIMANDGGLYDWIELYNGKDEDINLTNYSLSDVNDKIKWVFPENTIIKGKGYLIVFLAGKNSEGLIANFKLSSKGDETLILRNAKKKIIDAVETKPLDNNQVMGRDIAGSWHIYGVITPGFVNTLEGNTNYLDNLKAEENPMLSINEVLPSNEGYFKDSFGNYSGYIEIINNSDQTINLSEYAISNNYNMPFQYVLPDVNLKKNEVFLILTSNKNTALNNEYHANFKLTKENGVIILAHNNKITAKVEYNSLANGIALIKDNNNYIETASISPGYENDKDGIISFQKKYMTINSGLIINEVMSSNYSYLPQNGGIYYDWIELYNNSNKEIKLKEYCIGKNDTACNNSLPDITLKAHEYYVFMASGDVNLSNSSYKHINIKIGDNDSLYLFKDKKIIDSLFVPALDPGYSFGKNKGYGVGYFTSPTPKTENKNGTIAIATPPTIKTVGGIYNDVEKVTVEIYGEGAIYYTTDGTNPSTSSIKYVNPINLKKTTSIKAIAVKDGKRNSSISHASYIINENHTVPVLAISIAPDKFNTINKKAWTTGIEFEAYAEYFEKNKEGFVIPCGFKVFGGSTRGPAKKSYALKFTKKYGAGKLNYQVFDNRDYSAYDSLVLRTGSQDEPRAMIRDILGTSLVDDVTEAYVQAYKTVILYINGKYWGIYFIREKIEDSYVANNFNTSNPDTDILRVDGEIKTGNNLEYNKLISYINNNDLSKNSNYEYVKSKIDITSLIDFWVASSYVTNNDIVNYRYFRNPDVDDGKWKFIFYDLDWAWYNYDLNYYQFATNPGGMTVRHYTTVLLRNLMKNSEFKKIFVERVSYQLKNVWNKERVLAKYDELVAELAPEIKRNHERWGYSLTEYNTRLAELKTYIEKREGFMIKQTVSFFNLNSKEKEKYFGD